MNRRLFGLGPLVAAVLVGCVPAPGESAFAPTGDADGDGITNAEDCAPLDVAVYGGATEIPQSGVDENCDGFELCFVDVDSDGLRAELPAASTVLDCAGISEATPIDCDDTNPVVSAPTEWVLDVDGDGWGSPAWNPEDGPFFLDGTPIVACSQPEPQLDHDGIGRAYVARRALDDCQDGEASAFPENPSPTCSDTYDSDCSGSIERCVLDSEFTTGIRAAEFSQSGPLAVGPDSDGNGAGSLIIGQSSRQSDPDSRLTLIEQVYDRSSSPLRNTHTRTVIFGATSNDRVTRGVNGGDVDGDGDDDIWVSETSVYGVSETGTSVYLLPGPFNGDTSDIDVGSRGAKITDAPPGNDPYFSRFGFSLAGAGDIDDDGYAELLVGNPQEWGNISGLAGAAYLIYGTPVGDPDAGSPGYGSVDAYRGPNVIEAFGNEDVVTFVGVYNDDDGLGASVASGGDLDGDGINDLLIGTGGLSVDGMEMFVVPGDPDWRRGTTQNIHDVAVANYTSLAIMQQNEFGISMVPMGDLDGDGYGEVAAGGSGYLTCPENCDPNALTSNVWVVFHAAAPTGAVAFDDVDIDRVAKFEDSESNAFGRKLAALPRGDGDGLTDLLVGSSGYFSQGNPAGAVYLIAGWKILDQRGDGSALSVAEFAPESGIWARGVGGFDAHFGSELAGLGDLDGDGYDDFVVGDHGGAWANSGPGRSYIFLQGIDE